jgi:hypothetical protein
MIAAGRYNVTLPDPPVKLFSRVVVMGPDGQKVATINPHTRVRTDASSGSRTKLALPIWFTDPQKVHYEGPLGKKREQPLSFEKTHRRKTRDWVK